MASLHIHIIAGAIESVAVLESVLQSSVIVGVGISQEGIHHLDHTLLTITYMTLVGTLALVGCLGSRIRITLSIANQVKPALALTDKLNLTLVHYHTHDV